MTRIVLVEANFIRRQALHQLLAELGAEVVAVNNAAEAAQTPPYTPGVVLIEYQAALEQRAFELVRQRDLRIVLVSWQHAEPPVSAREEGAHGFIDLSGEERAVRTALQRLAHHGDGADQWHGLHLHGDGDEPCGNLTRFREVGRRHADRSAAAGIRDASGWGVSL